MSFKERHNICEKFRPYFTFHSLCSFSGFARKYSLIKLSCSGPLGSIPRAGLQTLFYQLIDMNFFAAKVAMIFKESSLQSGYM